MEQTALRPKPKPGQEPGGTGSKPVKRPHAARRRGRRLTTLLLGLLVAVVLVLSGVGLGTVAATVIGMSKLAELQSQPGRPGRPGPSAPASPVHPSTSPGPSASGPSAAASTPPADMVLGVEVVDAEKSGALIVGVHVPGPGYTAGLVRGDVLLTFDGTPVESAADLVRAVDRARPGATVTVTVRHEGGGYQQLAVAPGIVT
ncbi:PDZ domain-containing protein [Streptomyces spinoverrucosus]|uniref:PDZ domain-containing protein n=1 Tax=Streptomyces spinoverrucosus TaxID=284043 RepID=A0A4Y3VBQ8_9ACTN|nr:PDZ domain-containing protein [Streptomyces spinoverrucosus]GEC03803.1 PDZ domain-containing protein [Streptomyces spinoverrucosus]GHB50069.1 PDZ domain-containing protein [Streptomyces spinoverrucosus]